MKGKTLSRAEKRRREKRKKRIWISVAAVALCLVLAAAALALFPRSGIRSNGMLRVYLASLANESSLTLSFFGPYETDTGLALPDGTAARIDAGEGGLTLTAGGTTVQLPETVQFIRRASNGAQGIVISQASNSRVYQGDLTVAQKDGKLAALLTIFIEDYLYGVVPYEMNDSWPIEALKAQAVAARSYALVKSLSRTDASYDLTDTANDQVFRGRDFDKTNAARAVDETRGMVATYEGEPVTCYYTASNGGQTALPEEVWGGSAPYLVRKDDPYDLENENSAVASAVLSADGQAKQPLLDVIEYAITQHLKSEGVSCDWARLDSVLSLSLEDPASEDSRMYQTLRITLTATALDISFSPDGEEPAGVLARMLTPALEGAGLPAPRIVKTPLTETGEITLDLDLYGEVKDKAGLALNGRDVELSTIATRTDEAGLAWYRIELRRSGHGIGMSQRGAQTMADAYGKTCQEILSFYYPGISLTKVNWRAPSLSRAASAATPAPLRALKDGEYYALVTLTGSTETLNVREESSTSSPIVTTLRGGARVIVMDKSAGWAMIDTGEITAFVKSEYLIEEGRSYP